jgi:hypothetical protein
MKHPNGTADDTEAKRGVTTQADTEARTPLGRGLRQLRVEILESGAAPLDWDEIDSEVASRRGGWREGS